MKAPTYHASGGVIFQREHAAMTLERAYSIKATHQFNASFWLSQGTIPAAKRLEMAEAEQALADEMAAAIAEITQPMERAA